MKKLGWYLMSFVPLVGMLGIQLVVTIAVMMAWIITAGYEGAMQIYTDNAIVVVTWMHVSTLVVMGLWYWLYVVRRQKKAGIPFAGFFTGKSFGFTVMLAFGAQLLIGLILTVWQYAAPDMIEAYNQMMEESGIATTGFLSIIATVILAPIGEEIIFRGLTMEYLKKAGAGFWAANVIQAFFFGFAHLNLVQGTYAFLLGLTCGYVVLRYRSLLAGIAVHMVFNAYGTFVTPLLNMIFGSEPSAAVEIGCYVAAIVFGAGLFADGLILVKKDLKEKEEREEAEQSVYDGASPMLHS